MCHEKAMRDISRTNIDADVLIVSQALAESTLRKSGVNFYNEKLELGPTGRNLEKFLSLIGRTVDFRSDRCVYNTEIAQCYPGKTPGGKGDRKPLTEESLNCVEFLREEIALVQPRLILAMGKASFEFISERLLDDKSMSPTTIPREADSTYLGIPVIPIQHASPANPRFYRMLEDHSLIDRIRNFLSGQTIRKRQTNPVVTGGAGFAKVRRSVL